MTKPSGILVRNRIVRTPVWTWGEITLHNFNKKHLGVRCLARGSHLSSGQFLPEPRFEPTTSGYKSDALSIRATTACQCGLSVQMAALLNITINVKLTVTFSLVRCNLIYSGCFSNECPSIRALKSYLIVINTWEFYSCFSQNWLIFL